MTEQIKIVLLSAIALGFVIKTVIMITGSNDGGAIAATEQVYTEQFNVIRDAADIAAEQSNIPMTTIQFEESSFDFGTIVKGKKVRKSFKFTNTGDNPLIIKSAIGSCGCTIPEYPKAPIPPGGTGEIMVVFDSGKVSAGKQTKNVTVTSNTKPATFKITVTGESTES